MGTRLHADSQGAPGKKRWNLGCSGDSLALGRLGEGEMEAVPFYPDVDDPQVAIEMDLQGAALSLQRLQDTDTAVLIDYLDKIASLGLGFYTLASAAKGGSRSSPDGKQTRQGQRNPRKRRCKL